MTDPIRWLVVMRRDADPIEVLPFSELDPALKLYDRASAGWSDVYLCGVLAGPRDVCGELPSVREAARRRLPLGGASAQALEGALQQVERERDQARAERDAALASLREIAELAELRRTGTPR